MALLAPLITLCRARRGPTQVLETPHACVRSNQIAVPRLLTPSAALIRGPSSGAALPASVGPHQVTRRWLEPGSVGSRPAHFTHPRQAAGDQTWQRFPVRIPDRGEPRGQADDLCPAGRAAAAHAQRVRGHEVLSGLWSRPPAGQIWFGLLGSSRLCPRPMGRERQQRLHNLSGGL